MTRLTLGLFLVATTTLACSSSPGTGSQGGSAGTSAGGAGGGAGSGGSGGTSAGGTGGGSAFMSIMPCPAESDYATDGGAAATVNFGGSVGFFYDPKCLKVSAGATVAFSGDFTIHPLQASSLLGNTTNNPIAGTTAGTTASFTFPNSGFYAYRCSFHGSDDGVFMSGVIWVQ